MIRVALGALLLLAACTTEHAAPRPAASAVKSRAGPLLAVARPAASRSATVSIVTETGTVVASAGFDLAPVPLLANAAPMLQPPVRVAGGAVFYADAHGVVRRLDRDGRIKIATTFPLTSAQQELSFAVRPDGKQLIASVMSAPPVHDPPPRSLEDPFFAPGGRWTLELFTATAGGTPTSTFKRDLGPAFPGGPTIVVGWDSSGPLATLNTVLARQDVPLTERFTGSPLVHLVPDGTHLDQVGGPDCNPLDELLDGTVLCQVGRRFEVRRASGQLLWRQDIGDAFSFTPTLSPDAQRIASMNTVFSRSTRAASGARQASSGAAGFFAEGWMDSMTIVAATNGTSLSRLGPGSPLLLVDAGRTSQTRALGVTGVFEGVL